MTVGRIAKYAGWLHMQVRSGGGQQSPYIDALISASGLAESQALGVFTKVGGFIIATSP